MDWKENLVIDLTPAEAAYLSTQIKNTNPNSVFAFILRAGNDIEKYENFSSFSMEIKPILDETNASMMDLADRFNDFISLAQIRYNLMLSEGKNEKASNLWDKFQHEAPDYAKRVDLDAIFGRLHLNNRLLLDFLKQFRDASISENWDVADSAIFRQEVRIKGGRVKLKNKSKYPVDKWIGSYKLDYRFSDARRLIMDIRKGGNNV